MKKILAFLTIAFVFASCDELLTEEFIVDNHYDKSIKISLKNMNGEKFDTLISANTNSVIFYTNTGYGNGVYQNDIENWFIYFKLSSDTMISKVNLLKNIYWKYSQVTETYAKYYLTIDSTYFK